MTDRIKAFAVILEKDYRDDDASEIMVTLQNIRGVARVIPNIVDASDIFARERVKFELLDKLREVLK